LTVPSYNNFHYWPEQTARTERREVRRGEKKREERRDRTKKDFEAGDTSQRKERRIGYCDNFLVLQRT